MPNIIGVTGYARHGKNTVAEIIKEFYGEDNVAIIGFADALRKMAKGIDPPVIWAVDENRLVRYNEILENNGYEYAKTIPEVRRFLQRLGTEGVREVLGDDTWIRALDFAARESKARLVVVPDTRFQNEADYIEEEGELWGVKRPGFDNGLDTSHPSESYVATAYSRAWKTFEADTVDSLRSQVIDYLMLREKHYSLMTDWEAGVPV